MTFTVCVPYRSGNALREATWEFTRRRWESFGLEVVTGDRPEHAWSCARARNAAAEAAGDWTVALFADADELLDYEEQATAALALAEETGAFVACYADYRYLDAVETKSILAGAPLAHARPYYTLGGLWTGPFAIHRALWDTLGGNDEAYGPYDGEDVAFVESIVPKGGKLLRVPGNAYHCWHGIRGHVYRP